MPPATQITRDPVKALEGLREHVSSVNSNFTMAVAFHEVWRPTAQDAELHGRMGKSYASQAFLIIRAALRREMLLGLMRIWDTTTGVHSLKPVFCALEDARTWEALTTRRTSTIQDRYIVESISSQLLEAKNDALLSYRKYCKGGTHYEAYRRLRTLRHVNLAHTQSPTSDAASMDPADDEVSEFYEETSRITSKLMSIVQATAIDYQDTTSVYAHYARLFWANARGEATPGHPSFRGPTSAA